MIEPSDAVTLVVSPPIAVALPVMFVFAVVTLEFKDVMSVDSELIVPSAVETLVSRPPIAEALAARFVLVVPKLTPSAVMSLDCAVIDVSVAVTRVIKPLTAVALALIAVVFAPISTIALSTVELRFFANDIAFNNQKGNAGNILTKEKKKHFQKER